MKRFDQINMIPFIDIVLVLLAIVLTTASFVSTGLIEVSIPEVSQPLAQQTQQKSIEIAVDERNQWFADGQAIERDQLASFAADYAVETPFKLRVDATADFEAFLAVVDTLKVAGYKNIRVQVRKQ